VDAKNLVGTKLDGRYEVSRVIGAGGMGAVYEAHHVGTRRRVAVKVISTGDLSKDEQLIGRFQREAKAAGAVDTQHICQVLDTGVDAGTGWPFMVMEYMAGEDVQQLVRRVGALHADLALRITAQSCMGLQKAHDAGVVHRDIKPANLFLAKSDAGSILVKLLDFGIAKVKIEHASELGDAGLTRTGTMLGSPLYMSPEQARGVKTIDHRADIWSLGIVLYEMLTGRTPYHHIEALGELIIAICSEPPRPVQDFAPWITPEVAAIVHKALRANPHERFQSAAEMLAVIRPLPADGTNIDDTMLVSLSETHKALVAKRLTMPPPPANGTSMPPAAYAPSTIPAQSVPPPSLTQEGAGTTGGTAVPTERRPAPQKSSAGLVAVGAALSIAVLGGLGYAFLVNKQGPPQSPVGASVATDTATATTTPGVTPSPAASPTVMPSPRDDKEIVVELVIFPKDAVVHVDGKPVKAKNGVIEFSGGMGSVHKVKLTKGAHEIEENVTISDRGARPPNLELDTKSPPGTRSTSSTPATTATAKPTSGQVSTSFND